MKYAWIHGNLFDGTENAQLRKNVTVLTDGEAITAVQPGDAPVPEGYEPIDLAGRYLLPGLVNLHAHLFGSGKPSKSLGGGGRQKLAAGFAKSAIGRPVIDRMVEKHVTQALHAGVTTIRSSGDFNYSDLRTRNRILARQMPGPRLLVPGPAITCVGGHGDGTFAQTSDRPAELAGLVEERASRKADYIKICVTGGVMDAKVKGEPGEVKMTLEQTKAVCDRAHALGFSVASHTESKRGIRVALEGGVDTIEHGSYLDERLIDLFLERGAALVVTTSPALPLAKLPADITLLNDLCFYNSKVVLEGMIEGGKCALKNGIPVGLGTDESCPLVTPYSMWREVAYFAKYYGVSNAFALHTATLGNARIARIGDVTGSIEPGKCADLLVLRDNPLEDLKALETVDMVMARGELLREPRVQRNKQVDAWLDSIR